MIQNWLEFARGPLFWFALTFLILGLARRLSIMLWESFHAYARAGDRDLRFSNVARKTIPWFIPARKMRNRRIYGITSVLFHVSILIVPLFLAGHVELIRMGIGFGWPSLPNAMADVLTILAIVAAFALIAQRAAWKPSRSVSRFSDYALPAILALPFVTGLMLRAPALNPASFDAMMLAHVLTAELTMILIPLTKASHCALMPFSQWIAAAAWKWPADAGSKVGADLGKENEPV